MFGLGLTELLIFVAITALPVWCAVDVIRNQHLTKNEQLLWLLICLLIPLFGPVLYFVWGRRPGRAASIKPLTPGPSPEGEGSEL